MKNKGQKLGGFLIGILMCYTVWNIFVGKGERHSVFLTKVDQLVAGEKAIAYASTAAMKYPGSQIGKLLVTQKFIDCLKTSKQKHSFGKPDRGLILRVESSNIFLRLSFYEQNFLDVQFLRFNDDLNTASIDISGGIVYFTCKLSPADWPIVDKLYELPKGWDNRDG